MKYTLILLLFCLPLVALTVWSIVDAVRGADAVAARAPALRPAQVAELIKNSTPLAHEAKDRADKNMPLVRQLADANLWEPHPGNLGPAGSDEFIGVVAAARQSSQACQLVDGFAPLAERLSKDQPVAEDSTPQRRKKADDARQELATFHKNYRAAFLDTAAGDPVKGAAAFFELVARRAADRGSEVDGIDLSIRIDDALRAARQALAGKKYAECLAMLSADPLKQAIDEPTRRELAALRLQAQYGLDRQAFDQRRAAGPADRALLSRADDFLTQYSKAPIASEESSHDEIKRYRAKLEVDLRTAELKNISDLEPLLADAAEIVKLPAATEQHKAAVRGAVSEWLLTRGFPRLQPPTELLDKREAWTKKGDRMLGYFELPAGVEQWRFWRDKQGFENRNPPVGNEQIRRDSFAEDPAIPKYVQWATTYNKITNDLVDRPSTKAEWQNFIAWCERADNDIVAYRNRQGVGIQNEPDRSCAGWSFGKQAAMAQKVISRWDLFQQVKGQ